MSALEIVTAGFDAGGGGGGGGAFTATVTDRVVLPPAPLAVSVYVVELTGDTCWLPLACTAPTPWSIDMFVAAATVHRSVADWPRWMVVGSAVKLSMRGGWAFGAGGGGGASTTGGGGGGAAATFFLHPAAASKSVAAHTAAPSVLMLIRVLYVLMVSL
jgi:hypothetical protein